MHPISRCRSHDGPGFSLITPPIVDHNPPASPFLEGELAALVIHKTIETSENETLFNKSITAC